MPVSGFGADMKLTAPFFQGVDMDPADELIRGRKWIWPHRWEAGLCIFHDTEGGFWVHCRDTAFRAKSLVTAHRPFTSTGRPASQLSITTREKLSISLGLQKHSAAA